MSTDSINASITDEIDIRLTFKGKHKTLLSISPSITSHDLISLTRRTFDLNDTYTIKLLHKGKVIGNDTIHSNDDKLAFPNHPNGTSNQSSSSLTKKSKPVKIIIMATTAKTIEKIEHQKSDPLIRGFDDQNDPHQQRLKASLSTTHPWGSEGGQDRNYKFVKMEECSEHSFGHRWDHNDKRDNVPHAFDARRLLYKLANDPGIVAIMKERELVVNYLGEMDPIDDRIMQKQQQSHPGGNLLGYNTNRGFRIDLKLRSDDLKSFRPYEELMKTLIHELSHNWVGDHNVLFWSNYAQMRVEYLYTHWKLNQKGYVVNGKTAVDLAGVRDELGSGKGQQWTMETIVKAVTVDVAREAAQHGIPVNLIVPSIMSRCQELAEKEKKDMKGQTLGHATGNSIEDHDTGTGERKNARSLALEAAERRRKAGGDDHNSGK